MSEQMRKAWYYYRQTAHGSWDPAIAFDEPPGPGFLSGCRFALSSPIEITGDTLRYVNQTEGDAPWELLARLYPAPTTE